MKRMRKKLFVSCLLLATMLFSTVSFAAGAEDGETLTIVDGRLSDESMMEAIDEYLNSKTLDTNEVSSMCSMSVSSVSTEATVFMEDTVNRNEAFHNLEATLDVIFDTVEIDGVVDEILSQNENTVVVSVYETTMIEYFATDGMADTDIMGYGTDHVITLELIGGEYQVVTDSFDERLVTGVCSTDLALTSVVGDVSIDEILGIVETGENSENDVAAVYSSYSVNAAVSYANQWCGVAAAKNYASSGGITEGSDTSRYNNSVYQYYADADCANFVSQCLVAGGRATVAGVWEPGLSAWVNAKALHRHLATSYSTVSATNSNVFPGNPVYWWNGSVSANDTSPSGHQMICTGYNSAGVPVVNGHNPNMFRVPITALTPSANGLYTAQIVASDQHSHVLSGLYVTTASQHASVCNWCREAFSYTAHTFVTSGGTQYCSVCGYSGATVAKSSEEVLVVTE